MSPPPNAPPVIARDIERWLAQNIAALCALPADQVDVSAPILDLGIESLTLFSLAGDLAAWLERDISPTLLWECPTIAELAAHLSHTPPGARRALVPIQSHGTRPALYLIHDITGTLLSYKLLADHLGQGQPVYGFELPFSNDECGQVPALEELAARYVEELRAHQSDGPYFLSGYSMGGNIALEMARLLRAQGQGVAFVGLIDTWFPGRERRGPSRARRWYLYCATTLEMPRAQRLTYLKHRWLHLRKRLFKTPLPDLEPLDQEYFDLMTSPMCQALHRVLKDYGVAPFSGPVEFLRARTQWWSIADDATAWREVAPDLRVHPIPGRHESLVLEPNVRHLARTIRHCLQNAHPAP